VSDSDPPRHRPIQILSVRASSYDDVTHLPGNILSPDKTTSWHSSPASFSSETGLCQSKSSIGGICSEWLVVRTAPAVVRTCILFSKNPKTAPIRWSLLYSANNRDWIKLGNSTTNKCTIHSSNAVEAKYWAIAIRQTGCNMREYADMVDLTQVQLKN
jgi:hypothetical protein